MQDQKKNKVNLESLELTQDRIDELRKILPEVFTENKIDWEKLKQVLGEQIDKGTEKFGFMWVGKTSAINSVLSTSKLTLKPEKDKSIKFDESQNLIIEGDNLETLKLLQKAYFQKIKMIYIDPPYNTGGDFVYKDDYKAPLDSYLQQTGQKDENGSSLTTNKETNGRFHSSWLTMMYPRLKLAWNLLQDDGVIFISIDDCEEHRLKIVLDEIFGEENFVVSIIREAIKGGSQSKHIRITHDYIFCYAKDKSKIYFSGIETEGRILDMQDENGKFAKGRELNKWGAGSRRIDSPSMWFPIKGPDGNEVYPIRNDGTEGRWRLGKKRMLKLIQDNNIIFEKRQNGTYIAYEKIRDESPRIKQFTSLFKDKYINANGTEMIKKIFKVERSLFDYSKPVELIVDLMKLSNINDGDVVLDFFAGSGTTAQAVIELNKEDEERRRFILVQLPEQTQKESEAYKAGFKSISDICIERVKRVIKGYGDKPEPIQDGFKVFKLDKSNYVENNFEYDPSKTNEENTKAFEAYLSQAKQSSLFESVKPIDVVYENIVKEGLSLNANILKMNIDGNEVYKVEDIDNNLSFFITLDKEISKDTIRILLTKEYKNKLFIGLDSALSDSDKANLGLHLTLKTI